MDEDDQLRTSTTLKNVQSGIQKYLLTKTIISLCTATVGMILAVPMTSAINITLLQIDEKNLISAIISG
ncbi:MAG: hypothetical protein LRZ88_02900 [Candidatus Cloacimonetes bacterium]|nr:hypothetical protein [Candidatus Cloacimonadota bacterium]